MRDLKGDDGRTIGHQTIDQLSDCDLAVSPQNYEIWLNYLCDSNPDLKRELDRLLATGVPLSHQDMEAIYEEFFATTQLSTQVIETGSRIAHEIADALDALKKAGASTEKYGETLKSASNTLSSTSLDGESLKRIVTALAGATSDMSRQNHSLSQKLLQSSTEVEQLRKSLQQARAEALTDSLTGIANRKLFDQTLRLRCDEAKESDGSLSVLLCDIDHFKKFNDTWGHQTGDQVIRYVATVLAKSALPDHLVARYGGEEFAVIMPRTSLTQAQRIAEQVRRAIEAKRLVRRSTNETIGSVTISIGIAEYTRREPHLEVVARADACLYASKRNGRNRVTIETQIDDSDLAMTAA
ncbi:diguanylate cyclase [bacterium]|nr:diguanylate cyclase [bacterium]